ncbi:hypothetical protein LCGC14_3045860, partial [marine sediment metagenome]
RYPLYIGMGDPYRLVEDVRVVRSAGIVDTIPAVSTVNEIVSVGDLPGVSRYVDTTDYILNAGSDTISWVPGGTSPTMGNSYYITYTETRASSAFTPTLYFDGNLVIADHGNRFRTNGSINDVTVGAVLGLDNNAKGVVVAQLNTSALADPDNPSSAQLEAAFIAMVLELEKLYGPKYLIVPMSSGVLNTVSAAQIMFNHSILASQPERKQERSVIQAMAADTTIAQYATMAQSFANERMCLPAIPSNLQVIGMGTTTYDDRYYCAALAGRLCAGPIGETISDEIIVGITFDDNFNPDAQDYLVQNGVSPAKSSGSVIRNVMAISPDTTNALTEDMGVLDIKDYVRKTWREGLWNLY